jgi:hypothetical protein
MGVSIQETGRQLIGRGALDLAAGEHPVGIAIDQLVQQYRRMARLRPALRMAIPQSSQIQLIDNLNDAPSQVVGR